MWWKNRWKQFHDVAPCENLDLSKGTRAELQGRELFAQVNVQRSQQALTMLFWESVPKVAAELRLKDEGINPRDHRGPGNQEQSGKGHLWRCDHTVSDQSVLRGLGQLGFAWLSMTLHEPQEVPHEEACEESHPYLSLSLSEHLKRSS